MKLEVYRADNIAYLSLEEDVKVSGVARTLFTDDEALLIDLDEHGRVLGFEFLAARRQLGPLFDSAPEPTKPEEVL